MPSGLTKQPANLSIGHVQTSRQQLLAAGSLSLSIALSLCASLCPILSLSESCSAFRSQVHMSAQTTSSYPSRFTNKQLVRFASRSDGSVIDASCRKALSAARQLADRSESVRPVRLHSVRLSELDRDRRRACQLARQITTGTVSRPAHLPHAPAIVGGARLAI